MKFFLHFNNNIIMWYRFLHYIMSTNDCKQILLMWTILAAKPLQAKKKNLRKHFSTLI